MPATFAERRAARRGRSATISLVICTRNRAGRLRACLAHVRRLAGAIQFLARKLIHVDSIPSLRDRPAS